MITPCAPEREVRIRIYSIPGPSDFRKGEQKTFSPSTPSTTKNTKNTKKTEGLSWRLGGAWRLGGERLFLFVGQFPSGVQAVEVQDRVEDQEVTALGFR